MSTLYEIEAEEDDVADIMNISEKGEARLIRQLRGVKIVGGHSLANARWVI